MNAKQYADYEQAVEGFLTLNKVKPGCYGQKHSEPEPGFEPFFSWRPCECCLSPLGGDRETYLFATEPVAGQVEANICMDCVYYLAYGVLDDATMLDIEESECAK